MICSILSGFIRADPVFGIGYLFDWIECTNPAILKRVKWFLNNTSLSRLQNRIIDYSSTNIDSLDQFDYVKWLKLGRSLCYLSNKSRVRISERVLDIYAAIRMTGRDQEIRNEAKEIISTLEQRS